MACSCCPRSRRWPPRAATVPELRVGTFVLAAPLRPPRAAAWEGHSMTVLTDGRFDFGIGTGLPRARQWADQLGLPYRSGPERLADVATAVEHLRELDGQAHTPVLMAAGGPQARALAARIADTVHLAAAPLATRDEVAAMAADVRKNAGDRRRQPSRSTSSPSVTATCRPGPSR